MASRFVYMCELCVLVCVLLRHQSGCLLVPRSKGSQPHLKQVYCAFWAAVASVWLPEQTHLLSKVILLIQSLKLTIAQNILVLTWPIWFCELLSCLFAYRCSHFQSVSSSSLQWRAAFNCIELTRKKLLLFFKNLKEIWAKSNFTNCHLVHAVVIRW